jgi:hypothetical protein
MRLGIREGMLYRLSGQPVCWSKWILDRRLDHSGAEVVRGYSNVEGATIETYFMGSMIDPRGGSSRSIFLAKR